MEHGAYLVDILNEQGQVVDTKRRRDVNKSKDIYNVIYIFLVTPDGQLVLTPILERHDLPNLYIGQLGAPVATIRRKGETALEAAHRAVARELFIDDADVQFVGEKLLELSDGRRSLASVFYLIGEPPQTFSKTDIGELERMRPAKLDRLVRENSDKVSPTLQEVWQEWGRELPR